MSVNIVTPPSYPPSQSSILSKFGFGCAFVFALPFLGAGTVALVHALGNLHEGDTSSAGLVGTVALVSIGVGTAILALGLAAKQDLERQTMLRARYPDQPWRWRTDWTTGRIAEKGARGVYASWAMAVLWNLIAVPAVVLGAKPALSSGYPAAWLALVFPLAGAVLIIVAARSSRRLHKFGKSYFELDALPGVIGHGVSGTVMASLRLAPADGFHATLSCVELVPTGSGTDRTERVLWQDSTMAHGERGAAAPGEGVRLRVPLAFRIPADLPPSDGEQIAARTIWRLDVSARVSGVDYHSSFELPVFRTPASDTPLTEAEERLGPAAPPLACHQPAGSPIRIEETPRGVAILFPPARNPAVAAGFTAFSAAWGAVVWVLLRVEAPIFISAVFAACEVLLVYTALRSWLRVVSVTADAEGVAIASGILSPGAARHVHFAEIQDVEVKIGMQSRRRVYYDLVIARKDGGAVNAGSGIADKHEAEWLAARLRQATGLKTGAEHAAAG
ncbi:MAG TPA: hypothetical protein VFW66_07645 [Gemmatimonadales bacterium]|nr:hypothetical protein [Gemmatimonadales bacterium]